MTDASNKTAAEILAGLSPAARLRLEQAPGRMQGTLIKITNTTSTSVAQATGKELREAGLITTSNVLTMRGEIVAEELFDRLVRSMLP